MCPLAPACLGIASRAASASSSPAPAASSASSSASRSPVSPSESTESRRLIWSDQAMMSCMPCSQQEHTLLSGRLRDERRARRRWEHRIAAGAIVERCNKHQGNREGCRSPVASTRVTGAHALRCAAEQGAARHRRGMCVPLSLPASPVTSQEFGFKRLPAQCTAGWAKQLARLTPRPLLPLGAPPRNPQRRFRGQGAAASRPRRLGSGAGGAAAAGLVHHAPALQATMLGVLCGASQHECESNTAPAPAPERLCRQWPHRRAPKCRRMPRHLDLLHKTTPGTVAWRAGA